MTQMNQMKEKGKRNSKKVSKLEHDSSKNWKKNQSPTSEIEAV